MGKTKRSYLDLSTDEKVMKELNFRFSDEASNHNLSQLMKFLKTINIQVSSLDDIFKVSYNEMAIGKNELIEKCSKYNFIPI
jgi:hypothetical protein